MQPSPVWWPGPKGEQSKSRCGGRHVQDNISGVIKRPPSSLSVEYGLLVACLWPLRVTRSSACSQTSSSSTSQRSSPPSTPEFLAEAELLSGNWGPSQELPSPFPLIPTPVLLPSFWLPGEPWAESQGFMRTRCLSLVMAPLRLFFGDAKGIPNIKMLFVAFDIYFI